MRLKKSQKPNEKKKSSKGFGMRRGLMVKAD
jgi:hypothetical protein